jgi:hypothetical protein
VKVCDHYLQPVKLTSDTEGYCMRCHIPLIVKDGTWEEAVPDKVEKPPLGIKPRNIWLEERISDLFGAIRRSSTRQDLVDELEIMVEELFI